MPRASEQDNRGAKIFFINAFFDDLESKIKFLLELAKSGHEEEARLLCSCYIDALGLGMYWPEGHSKACFVRILKEYGGDDVLSKIHPKMLEKALMELGRKRWQAILSKVSPLLQQPHGRLYEETEILRKVTPALKTDELARLKKHLWRGTVAAIIYSRFRVLSVHYFGSPNGVSFDNATFRGAPVATIDFDMLYACLRKIAAAARKVSLSSGKWFGHDYK